MNISKKVIKALAVALTAVSVITLSGCNESSVEKEIIQPITGETKLSYVTAKAEIMTIEQEEKIPANLGYGTYKNYIAPFTGKIKENNVLKNQKVKKGEVLMSLDTTDLDFQINELEIKIAAMSDSIDRGYAQIELDKLLEKKNAAIVVAEFDGIVTECSFKKTGDDIDENILLCSVAVPDSIFVYNSEGAGKNLRFGMDVDLKINDVEYSGVVTAAPDTVPSSGSTKDRKFCAVRLNDSDLKSLLDLNDGAVAADAGWATIYAITTRRTNVLAVPENAVKSSLGGKFYCSILQGEEKFDMPVEVGATAGGYVEILSGLNPGDVVILSD